MGATAGGGELWDFGSADEMGAVAAGGEAKARAATEVCGAATASGAVAGGMGGGATVSCGEALAAASEGDDVIPVAGDAADGEVRGRETSADGS